MSRQVYEEASRFSGGLPSAISLLITLTLCSLVCKSKTCSNKHDSVNICKAFRRASHTYEELLLLI